MNKTKIEYGANGVVGIEAHGNKPLTMILYTTNTPLEYRWPDMLSNDKGSNTAIIGTLANGIKMVFDKNLVFQADPIVLQAKDVCKVELLDEHRKVLATVVNEAIY